MSERLIAFFIAFAYIQFLFTCSAIRWRLGEIVDELKKLNSDEHRP